MTHNATVLLPPLEKAWSQSGNRIQQLLDERDALRDRIDKINEELSLVLQERDKVKSAMDALEGSGETMPAPVPEEAATAHFHVSADGKTVMNVDPSTGERFYPGVEFPSYEPNGHQRQSDYDDGSKAEYEGPEDGANSPDVVETTFDIDRNEYVFRLPAAFFVEEPRLADELNALIHGYLSKAADDEEDVVKDIRTERAQEVDQFNRDMLAAADHFGISPEALDGMSYEETFKLVQRWKRVERTVVQYDWAEANAARVRAGVTEEQWANIGLDKRTELILWFRANPKRRGFGAKISELVRG